MVPQKPESPRRALDACRGAVFRYEEASARPGKGAARLAVGQGILLAALFAALFVAPAQAREGPELKYQLGEPIFHRVGDSRSIPERDVTCLAQDRTGFLWIGTHDGVVRYDGYTFRVFRRDARDPGSLSGNRIRVIRGARDGKVWIGTDDSGLSIFDPATESFQNLSASPKGLSSDSIRDIAERPDGKMWVSGAGGLDLVEPKGLAVTRVDPRPKGSLDPDRSRLGALLLSRRGDLFIGSAAGLAVRRKSGGVEAVADEKAGGGESLSGRPVYRLHEARDGAIWVGIFGGGVARVDPASGRARFLEPEARAYAFAQTDDETIWLGTPANGVEVRDSRSGELRAVYRHDASVPESVSSNRISSLLVDESGLVWIGTIGSGLVRYSPAEAGIRLLRHSPLRPDGLSAEEVESVFESSDGFLWVGTHSNGADVFDSARRVAGYRPGPKDGRSLDQGRVGAMTETADGAIWLGTSGTLNRLDRRTGRIEWFTAQAFGKTTGRISTLLPDREGRGLWVGSTAGLGFFDFEKGAAEAAAFTDGKRIMGGITDIAWHGDALWVASPTGLAVLSPGATRFIRLSTKENTSGTLPPGSPIDLLSTASGRLFAGLSSGIVELSGFDGKAAAFIDLSARLGVANERCDNLLEDRAGKIWVEDTLRFDPTTFAIRHFGPDEGTGRSIWQGAAIETRSGQLVFGGPDGLLLIDPRGLLDWSFSPPIVLTSLLVDGRPWVPHGLSRLRLSPGHESVAFEFAALDFSAPSRIRYRYRLSGFDREWRQADASHRTTTYTSLPPGTYTLEAQGSNREGVFGTSALALPVTIEPALYQRLPFRIAAVLLLVSLTWPLYRIRLHLMRQRQSVLHALVRERTRELRDSEQRALEASDAKSVFLANMSHELRTPLNAVLGFARLMKRSSTLTPADRDHLSIILRSGEHLLSLINQVLSISKIEAGKMTLDAEPFDLKELIQTVERMFTARCEEADLRFSVELSSELPPVVLGDPGKLRQVLINLLGNAVKFTAAALEDRSARRTAGASLARDTAGTVSLVAAWREGRASFAVSDTGIGIAEEEIGKLFTPFVQTESGRSVREGTGLGLAITKRIVELMDGSIAVSSKKGEGTTFRFEVALPRSDQRPARTEPARITRLAAGQTSPRIAVVDDTFENRSLLSTLLTTVGLDVKTAANGQEALTLWREWAPHLVFMDVRMPVMDGREATERIRQEEARTGRTRTVIVAQTASVFESESGALRTAGADDVLFKPYREEAIFGLIEGRLGLRFEREKASGVLRRPSLSIPRESAPRPSRVLVADDDPVNRTMARQVLAGASYEVLEAADGEEALELMQKEGPPEIVLLDIEMPRMGGLATLRHIREKYPDLPVVAMTAHSDPEEARRLLAAGMSAHVAKPLEPESLTEVLAELLHAPLASAAPGPRMPNPVAGEAQARLFGIDEATALRRFSGNRTLLVEVVSDFVFQHRDDPRRIREAEKRRDFEEIKHISHTLKGSAATLSAKAIADAARDIESAAAEGGIREEAVEVLERALAGCWVESDGLVVGDGELPHTLDPGALGDLLAHLDVRLGEQNLEALTLFKMVRPTLHSLCPADIVRELENQISRLDFAEARQALEEIREHLASCHREKAAESGSP